jgi:hypothetical protein
MIIVEAPFNPWRGMTEAPTKRPILCLIQSVHGEEPAAPHILRLDLCDFTRCFPLLWRELQFDDYP